MKSPDVILSIILFWITAALRKASITYQTIILTGVRAIMRAIQIRLVALGML